MTLAEPTSNLSSTKRKEAYSKNKTGYLGAPVMEQVRQLYSPAASGMHFVRDIAFGSDMRYARLKLQRRIEYHCDPREQYHFCKAKISRRAVRGISRKNLYRPIVHLKAVTHYTLQDKACEKDYE